MKKKKEKGSKRKQKEIPIFLMQKNAHSNEIAISHQKLNEMTKGGQILDASDCQYRSKVNQMSIEQISES